MFEPGYPTLDVVLGILITTGFVVVIAWAGLLATIATLAAHFVLLRAPITLDVTSWRGTATFVLLGGVVTAGIYGCLIAARAPRQLPDFTTARRPA